MKIRIDTIPHKDQRYPTVGDWFIEDDTIVIRVSQMDSWRHEALVIIHELVELFLCRGDGVSQEKVDAFDKEFERNRMEGDESEPGESDGAPYNKQHRLASGVERTVAAGLNVNWERYEKELNSL